MFSFNVFYVTKDINLDYLDYLDYIRKDNQLKDHNGIENLEFYNEG